jgi:hypothetical protein
MKQVIKIVTGITFLLAALSVSAQQSEDKSLSEKKSADPSRNKMNIFKVNLTALPLKNYSIQYERILHKHISAAIGIRFMPEGDLPFKNALSNAFNGDSATENAINNSQLGNFAFTPEFRFYVGRRGYGHGFYIAPYYRYANFNASSVPLEYDGGTTTKTINLTGDITTHTGGLMFGAQWFLGKYVTLDWWIIGAHFGNAKGTLTGTPNTPFTSLEQNDIRQSIEDINLPVGNIKAEVTANSAKAIFDGPWAGVRGAIILGIRF